LLQRWGSASRGGRNTGFYRQQPFHTPGRRRESDELSDNAVSSVEVMDAEYDAVEKAWCTLRHRNWQQAEIIRCHYVYKWTLREICIRRPGLKMKASAASRAHAAGVAFVAALCDEHLRVR